MALLPDRQSCPGTCTVPKACGHGTALQAKGAMDCPGQGQGLGLGLWETSSAWQMLAHGAPVPGAMVRSLAVPCSLRGALSCMAPGRTLQYLDIFRCPKFAVPYWFL